MHPDFHNSAACGEPGGAAGLSRRTFLTGAGIGVAGLATAALVAGCRGGASSPPASSGSVASGRRILIMVTLYGGNDGLNTVIPYQDSAYRQARPTLGYQPNEVLPLADGLGLHPNLRGLKALWDSRRLAVVRGVGYPDPVLSHFRGMSIWQTASPSGGQSTGMLGRWLDATGTDPMRAISVGATLPILLSGERSAGTAIQGGTLRIPGGAALSPILSSFDAPGPDRPGLAGVVSQSGADLLSVQKTLSDLLGSTAGATSARPTTLADQLDLVAQLIKAGSPTRVYHLSMGGFDNHAAEKDTHANLMTALDSAISGFVSAIESSAAGQGAVLMTYSEFGRRVAQNASGGTDHGTAAPLFVAGPRVKGGQFFGEEPSLTKLDGGNMTFTTDFRSVFSTMLAEVVGVDPKVAISGSFPTLSLL